MTVSTAFVSPLSGTIDLSNGAIVSESNWDALASDILHIAGTTGHIGARAYNSAAISIPNNTDTAVTFNSESYDTDPNGEVHSTASNTSRMTFQTAGKYLVVGALEWAANATGQRSASLRLNGSGALAIVNALGNATYSRYQVVTALYDFAAGDYVELVAYQDSGGALNTSTSGVRAPALAVAKV